MTVLTTLRVGIVERPPDRGNPPVSHNRTFPPVGSGVPFVLFRFVVPFDVSVQVQLFVYRLSLVK